MAFVHTQGVVLGKKYIPLELSYVDFMGYRQTFLIQSPISYKKAIRCYPLSKPEVIMTTRNGIPIEYIVRFLKERYNLLGRSPFLCKGESYQPDILKRANIPYTNIETVSKVPSIRTLERLYPYIDKTNCPFHAYPGRNKCSTHVVRLLIEFNKMEFCFSNNAIFSYK